MPFQQRTRSMDSISGLQTPRRKVRIQQAMSSSDVSDIEKYIEDELRRLNYHPDTTRHDHYIVHKHAFDQLVVSKAVVYKSILSKIKAEFEDCIEALEKGKSQAVYLQGMVKALMVEKSTLRQFIRRGDELEEKVEKLRNFNSSLRGRILAYQNERARRIASAEAKSLGAVKKHVKKTIPGLSLEELTDIPTLKKTLLKLNSQVIELQNASGIKFVERDRKMTLKNKITEKEEYLVSLNDTNAKLKDRCEVLKVVVEVSICTLQWHMGWRLWQSPTRTMTKVYIEGGLTLLMEEGG